MSPAMCQWLGNPRATRMPTTRHECATAGATLVTALPSYQGRPPGSAGEVEAVCHFRSCPPWRLPSVSRQAHERKKHNGQVCKIEPHGMGLQYHAAFILKYRRRTLYGHRNRAWSLHLGHARDAATPSWWIQDQHFETGQFRARSHRCLQLCVAFVFVLVGAVAARAVHVCPEGGLARVSRPDRRLKVLV